MAPKTRAKSTAAGAKDPNPKQTIKSKLYINTREIDSENTIERCCHCGASVRSEDTETTLQDTASAAANVPAEPLDSIQPVEHAAVLPEWEGRRRRSGLPTEDVELEVAEFFRSRWASMSVDEWVAATALVLMKNDPSYSAPVQKKSRPRRNLTRLGRRS